MLVVKGWISASGVAGFRMGIDGLPGPQESGTIVESNAELCLCRA